MRLLVFVLIAFAITGFVSPLHSMAQGGGGPLAPGTAAVSGVVLDEVTRQPVAGAIVSLGAPGRGLQAQPMRQLTDSTGRFLFTQLPAWDDYSLSANKFGYFRGNYGRGGSGQIGGRIRLLDGQWIRDLEITLLRYGSVSGAVIDEHGDPIVGAYVRVLVQVPIASTPVLVSGPFVTTDDRGRYRISGLMPGKYIVQMPTVQSSAAATVPIRTLAGMAPLAPGVPETATPVPRDPIVDLDDEVVLIAGRFPIPPRDADGKPTIYPITFYPSAPTLAVAVPIVLGAGEQRTGIDVRVTTTTGVRIRGVIDGPPESYSRLTVRLLPTGLDAAGEGSEVANAVVGERGEFTLVNVPPGQYTIDARRTLGSYRNSRVLGAAVALPSLPAQFVVSSANFGVFSSIDGTTYVSRTSVGDTAYFGRQHLVVESRDVNDVRVTMQRGVTISGRIVWDGKKSNTGGSLLSLLPARGDTSVGVLRASSNRDGADVFTFQGVGPGEYLMSGTVGRIKSVICKGEDHTYTPIDTTSGADLTDCVVTFTDKAITISGTVRDERVAANALVDAAVVVFPVEREQWTAYTFSAERIKSLNTTSAGTFRFSSLPEGDYYLIALPGDQMNAWQDPALLERAAAQATRVSLKWGDTKAQDLTVKVIK